MKTISPLCAFALLMALSAPAAAQQPANAEIIEHDFDDPDDVVGGTITPYDNMVSGRKRLGRRTLIRTRVTFVPEMLKSVENM